MAAMTTIKAEARGNTGTGAARAVRRTGRIPGIVYGETGKPTPIAVDAKQLETEMHRKSFFVTLYGLELDGKTERVLPRDLQLHPVSDRPTHVDFLRVGKETKVRVNVPVVAKNEGASPGIKRGGVLNVVRHEVELVCKADDIPQIVEVDLTGLDIGDSVKIRSIKLPEGVKPAIQDRDFTIVTVAPPTVMQEEAAAAAAAAASAPTEAEAAAAAAPGAAPGAAPAAGAAAPAAGGAAPAKGAASAAGAGKGGAAPAAAAAKPAGPAAKKK